MVKLASAREKRMYGTWESRNKMEYVNAGVYLLATVMVLGGFVAQLSGRSGKSGLVLVVIGVGMIMGVNVHDLFAHMAGINFELSLMRVDAQLGLVEFAVPLVQALGSLLTFFPFLLFFVEAENKHSYERLDKYASRMLISGSVLWVIGSIHNACQIYERASGHLQILQASVQIPFLMGSLLFLAGAVLNSSEDIGLTHGTRVMGTSCIWLGIFGSLLFLTGAVVNLVKVFMMQQMDAERLEGLRNDAEEDISRDREAQVPLISEEPNRTKKKQKQENVPVPTPYKDVLLGHH